MKASIMVQNLKCGGCAKTITNKVSTLDHISNVQVNPETSIVSFEFEEENDAIRVKDKLNDLGYPSVDSENSLTKKAKSFVSCATGKMSK